MKLRAGFAATVCGLVAATVGWAADQPQWGQRFSRNMVSDEKGLPDSFDPATGRNIKWSVPLGSQTHSTPVVSGGKVLIGTNNEEPRDPRHKGDRGVLMCLDEKDGHLCWQLVVPKITTSNYWDWPIEGICSPATVDGDRVYTVSNRGEVMCLDLNGMANGNDGPFKDEGQHMVPIGAPPLEPTKLDADILWLFDMIKECGIRQHDSAHCSILVHGRFLYVNTSNGVDDSHKGIASPDAPSLIVLDKTTGRLVARDNEHIGPNIFHCTWSSPSLGEVGGRPLIFFAGGNGVVYAFDAVKDGRAAATPQVATLNKVWSFDFDSTAPKEDVHSYLNNRHESPVNILGMPVFYKNRVYVAGGGDLWWGKNQAWLKCIDATKTGDVTKTAALWSYPLERHSMSTPAIANGLVFIADCGRKVHCLDAETGQPYWTHETNNEMWGSTLVADGKVYIGTRRGDFWVLAASKEKKIISSVEFGHSISATPTAANGVLYIATMKQLFAVKQSPDK